MFFWLKLSVTPTFPIGLKKMQIDWSQVCWLLEVRRKLMFTRRAVLTALQHAWLRVTLTHMLNLEHRFKRICQPLQVCFPSLCYSKTFLFAFRRPPIAGSVFVLKVSSKHYEQNALHMLGCYSELQSVFREYSIGCVG